MKRQTGLGLILFTIFAILRVAHDRVSNTGEMNAYLVLPTR